MGQVPRPKSLPTVALEPGNDLFNNYSLPRSWPSCREKLVIYSSHLSIAKNSSSCLTLTICHLKKIKLGNTGEASTQSGPMPTPTPMEFPSRTSSGACFSQSPWPYTNRRRSLIIYAPSRILTGAPFHGVTILIPIYEGDFFFFPFTELTSGRNPSFNF